MNKRYGLQSVILSVLSVVFLISVAPAQTVGDVMWQDLFEDTEVDTFLRKNVGWWYYDESDGLIGQETVQTDDFYASITAGNYTVVGVGLIQTNGVTEIWEDDEAATKAAIVQNDYSDPNQEITFKVNLLSNTGSIFICGTRMPMTDSTETLPDSDPTEEPGYALVLDPLSLLNEGINVLIAKYEGSFAFLDPTQWTYFGVSPFSLDLAVWYYVKFYLYEGEIKVKIWEGLLEDEPDEWLLVGTDPEPRVEGNYTTFAYVNFNDAAAGDIFYLDDIVVRGFEPATAIEQPMDLAPAKFELANNYPNPFNPKTTIEFSLDKNSTVNLNIYTITGQLVRTLVNEQMAVGAHKVVFDGMDNAGRPLSSGIYFYQIQTEFQSVTKKMVLMK